MISTIEEVYQFFQSRKGLGIKLGLSRMEKMLALLDNPEKNLKVIHIAGTNGKGSTLTFIKESLIANNYKVGTFTSPSLDRLHDHIHLNNSPIDDQAFIHCINQLNPVVTQLDDEADHPTEYEILVMIAILYFIEEVDIAIFETNMGGRDDSTNCLVPIVSVITNIGIDHATFLGETKEEIAKHKAGIIKSDTPVIIGNIENKPMSVIEREAKQKNATIYQWERDFRVSKHSINKQSEEVFSFKYNDFRLNEIALKMKGEHQVINATTAVMTLLLVSKLGFPIDFTAMKDGLHRAFIPGRFEQVYSQPIIILDGAHNEEAIATFLSTVNRYYPDAKKHLLFAAFKDKPIDSMLKKINNHVFNHITMTTFVHNRALSFQDITGIANKNQLNVEANWENVIVSYMNSKEKNSVLFVTGSLYFIGLVRSFVKSFD